MVVALSFLLFAVLAAFIVGSPERSVRGASAASSFLTAWQHKLEGTYLLDATFTRRVAGSSGSPLVAPLRIAQRPPSRLVVGLGNVSGRTADAVIRCPADPAGNGRCFSAPGAQPYSQEVADELATLRSYLDGPTPLYRVVDFRDGCWRLDLARALPSPPYGDHALFCFDRRTGAPLLTVLERKEATDETRAVTVRSTVTDADLTPPADRGTPPG